MKIGIHVGEVEGSDSALRGAGVHRAARLSAAARPDSILVSRDALSAAGRPFRGLQDYTLKGIKEPVAAAEVSWDQ